MDPSLYYVQGDAAVIELSGSRRVVVALGSNRGDREAHLLHAVTCLQAFLDDISVSAFIESTPQVPSLPTAPLFLNGVVVGGSSESPRVLLDQLHRIEDERGRVRSLPGESRTLDLDLILVGNLTVNSATLTLPHPRFRERDFVLEPLASIDADLVDPVSELTVKELLRQLRR